jgi:hypothetical protein
VKFLLRITVILLLFYKPISAYDDLLFKPLAANIFEPRIGCLYQWGENNYDNEKLRLDIGASFDLAGWKLNDDSSEIRFGTDWFTYTRLRTEGNMKFPVETSDYFFGVNSSIKTKLAGLDFYSRLRLAHISSHIVDGLATGDSLRVMPFVYSREFADLTVALIYRDIRFYLGLTYVFSHQPKSTEEIIPQFGIDYNIKIIDRLYIKSGIDFRIPGLDSDQASFSMQVGMLLVTSENVGIMLNYNYFSGRSIHGMFYNYDDNYHSIGFQVLFYGINF